jgi:AcrR family transcriptional regulator
MINSVCYFEDGWFEQAQRNSFSEIETVRTKTPELDQRILDAAARLFAGNHFHAVRMEDISLEANVGKGTLYLYFRDKEELYLALLSRAADQIEERIEDIASDECDPIDKLEALVDAILTFFDEQPHIFELIQQAEASRGTNHPWQPARDVVIKEVVRLFEEGKYRGNFKVRDPGVTALVLLGGVRAVVRFGPKNRPERLARKLVDTVLFGATRRLGD